MRCTLDFGDPLPQGWSALGDEDRSAYWSTFKDTFGFCAGTTSESWPAIREPTPSVTFDLANPAGPGWAARLDAINAEALRCFITEFDDDPTFVVLDWQHDGYLLDAAAFATAHDSEWRVPVYPNGDYYIFLRTDFTAGTFGHPWEQTLCIFGERLVASLGQTLATWLPRKRIDGQPCL